MTAAYHDLGYRALFAHPEIVRELITGFTPFKLLDGVALSAFERVNADYVSERPSARQGDVVWRVQIGEQFLDVYILLECQSGVDRCMALRMQTYVGLLYQDVLKRRTFSPQSRLPPVLPLVFYNGAAPWNASLDLADLLMEAPAELADLQPSQRYALIDQQRLDRTSLEANAGLLALLFRIELSLLPDVLHTHLQVLQTWLKALARRRTGNQDLFDFDCMEMADMESTMLSWAEQMQEIGFQKGVASAEKAREEAREEARAEGQVIALRATLGKVLRIRFGAVADECAQRIARGTQDELESWIERSLTASSLAELFGNDAAPVPGESG